MEDEAEHEEEDDGDVIAPDETPDGTVMYCKSSAVNVWMTMPSTQGAVTGELTAGRGLRSPEKKGWYEIVFEGGSAYVYEDYLTDTKQE